MKTCVLTANLGSFDNVFKPVFQNLPLDTTLTYHCFDDSDFPPITGLTPRLQYRIPKTHGWQMKPGHDVYVWLDGSMSLGRENALEWLLDQLGDNDIALFKHPWRKTIKEEVEHIEEKLAQNHPYITPRYANGLHREQLELIQSEDYEDDTLYASTVFIYRNTHKVSRMLMDWWYCGTRYFSCDQIPLPYLLKKHNLKVKTLDGSPFRNPYVTVVSRHH